MFNVLASLYKVQFSAFPSPCGKLHRCLCPVWVTVGVKRVILLRRQQQSGGGSYTVCWSESVSDALHAAQSGNLEPVCSFSQLWAIETPPQEQEMGFDSCVLSAGLKPPTITNQNAAKTAPTKSSPAAGQGLAKQAVQSPLQRSGSARVSRLNGAGTRGHLTSCVCVRAAAGAWITASRL